MVIEWLMLEDLVDLSLADPCMENRLEKEDGNRKKLIS